MRQGLRILGLLFFIVLVSIGLLGCASDDEPNQEENTTEESENNQEAASESAFPVTITDDSGEEVVIEEEPERIISVIPSATEIIFGLDLGDKVVGVTDNDNYPEEVTEIESVGGLELNTEKIISLEPDLVVADVNNGEAISQLREHGVNVLVLGAQSLEETYEDIQTVGKATGAVEKADEVVGSMKEDVESVKSAVQDIPDDERKTVWIEVGEELFSAGSGTFLNELVETAGGKNIISDQEGWPQVNEEEVIQANPDVIFLTYASYVENAVQKVKDRESWKDITAIKDDQVYPLNSDITERAGPRITEGLQMIAENLYPEKFNQE
ncbi:iron complex transport system substrate-binding protein [Salinibacillus kushneri]|uniref:Iron complex transport system substrate-binding protein n=1 Tax=Salinibacillus kushneri TaxID=237682 RepID=A0A1I0BDY1_9BACI|nr:ABC transporter substrate-binding protein [Salinibacillus kushneri]SET05049.1 iron complex transport system substrate-binding protein [Salinibacillus kushneri]